MHDHSVSESRKTCVADALSLCGRSFLFWTGYNVFQYSSKVIVNDVVL